jgi:hypothetical protein
VQCPPNRTTRVWCPCCHLLHLYEACPTRIQPTPAEGSPSAAVLWYMRCPTSLSIPPPPHHTPQQRGSAAQLHGGLQEETMSRHREPCTYLPAAALQVPPTRHSCCTFIHQRKHSCRGTPPLDRAGGPLQGMPAQTRCSSAPDKVRRKLAGATGHPARRFCAWEAVCACWQHNGGCTMPWTAPWSRPHTHICTGANVHRHCCCHACNNTSRVRKEMLARPPTHWTAVRGRFLQTPGRRLSGGRRGTAQA